MSDKKYYEFSTAGIDLSSPGPATVEEFDAAAGQGECLSGGVKDAIYRGHLPQSLHPEFVKIAEQMTGIKREVNAKATAAAKERAKDGAAVADVLENAVPYLERVLASADAAVRTDLVSSIQSYARQTYIDVSPSRRERGPSKENLNRADAILTQDDAMVESKVSYILSKVPQQVIDRDTTTGRPTRESLANGIAAALSAIAKESPLLNGL